jgi:hypothetical protein
MKTQRMTIKEFMNREKEYSKGRNIIKFGAALPLSILPMTTISAKAASTSTYSPVTAAPVTSMTSEEIYDKILVAFEPITTLIQALAYPVASVCVLIGAILIMVRAKDKGLEMISNAGLGIILVNILPLLLNLLVQILKGIV